MSGHSKWSKVKHQKAVTDVVKSKSFTKASRAISVAVKEGGGIFDINKNFKLRLAVELARSVNMPKENIERAIEKGKGSDFGTLETISYEAYGPYGVALIIQCATDNKNRTVADLKYILEHFGGHLAQSGSVTYQFTPVGIIHIDIHAISFDILFDILSLSSASDILEEGDWHIIITPPDKLHEMKELLEAKQIPIKQSSVSLRPSIRVELSIDQENELNTLVEKLEELDDVQDIYTNVL
jgi:YebC/PmpR family DNA-binding regulatory protein